METEPGSGSRVPSEEDGTSAMVPHFGHLAFFPALASGVRNTVEQLGQWNSIGIVD
ncbi:MAG: hypothetical protein ACC628_10535 [Pirellulaceae bacterium]